MPDIDEGYLTPGQVANMLHVSPKTISRWAKDGRVPCVVTLGGHRRFPREAIVEIVGRMAGRA